MPEVFRRAPALEKNINDIDFQKDIRVRLTGTVVQTKNNSLLLDDGKNQAEINFDESLDYLNSGQLVRVVARVLPLAATFELRGECVQILDDFDMDLYKRAREIIKD